jgi:hypothetical protein
MEECAHELRKLVWYETYNATLYSLQCLTCYELVGPKLGRKRIAEITSVSIDSAIEADFDKRQTQRDERNQARRAEYQNIRDERIAAWEERKTSRKENYSEYLKSPEWEAQRRKVLNRANHICEGCLVAPATEVHHLTYDNIYNELAFQLVAICRACHATVHHKEVKSNKLGL